MTVDCSKPYINVSLWDKGESGDHRHVQEVMRDLGIVYGTSHPDPIGDSWQFGDLDLDTIPDILPSYVKVHGYKPGK